MVTDGRSGGGVARVECEHRSAVFVRTERNIIRYYTIFHCFNSFPQVMCRRDATVFTYPGGARAKGAETIRARKTVQRIDRLNTLVGFNGPELCFEN